VSFTFGCPPADVIGRLQEAGSEVWVSVTRPAEAQEAAAAGADVLVVQGAEAGGHRAGFRDDPADDVVDGIGLLSLLQLVAAQASSAQAASGIRAVGTAPSNIPAGLPLVAAGGIMNGAAIAAVLAAGAAAAQLGTAFLRCPEAGTADVQRQALAGAAPTVMTRAFTGRLARGIRNAFTDSHSAAAPSAYPEVHHLTAPLRQAGRAAGNAEVVNLWAGQAYQLGRERPAGELVAELAGEARAAAAQLSGRLTGAAPAPQARGK
jgi:nitronate monooxygenase